MPVVKWNVNRRVMAQSLGTSNTFSSSGLVERDSQSFRRSAVDHLHAAARLDNGQRSGRRSAEDAEGVVGGNATVFLPRLDHAHEQPVLDFEVVEGDRGDDGVLAGPGGNVMGGDVLRRACLLDRLVGADDNGIHGPIETPNGLLPTLEIVHHQPLRHLHIRQLLFHEAQGKDRGAVVATQDGDPPDGAKPPRQRQRFLEVRASMTPVAFAAGYPYFEGSASTPVNTIGKDVFT